MRSLHHSALAAAVLFVAALPSQDINISNANVQFRLEFNPSSRVYVATPDFLQADPAGDPGGVLFTTAWAYRIDNDTREFIFNDANGQATFVNSGPIGTATWADMDGRGKLGVVATYICVPTGTTSGVVLCRMQITNISTAPLTLNLFHLTDLDVCPAANGYLTNTTSPGNDGRQQVTATACPETAEHFAGGADRWEIGSYTNVPAGSGNIDLYTQLENTTITNLRNDTVPLGPWDIRGAFQWQDRVLLPGQSEVFTMTMSHNTTSCAHSFNEFGSSMAGAGGPPTLTASSGALLGQTVTLNIDNAPTGTLGIFILGFSRGNITVGDLTLHVAAPSFNSFVPVGPTGRASMPLNLPSNMAYCGARLVGEGVVFGDTTTLSTTGLPVTHTRGGIWTLGSY